MKFITKPIAFVVDAVLAHRVSNLQMLTSFDTYYRTGGVEHRFAEVDVTTGYFKWKKVTRRKIVEIGTSSAPKWRFVDDARPLRGGEIHRLYRAAAYAHALFEAIDKRVAPPESSSAQTATGMRVRQEEANRLMRQQMLNMANSHSIYAGLINQGSISNAKISNSGIAQAFGADSGPDFAA